MKQEKIIKLADMPVGFEFSHYRIIHKTKATITLECLENLSQEEVPVDTTITKVEVI